MGLFDRFFKSSNSADTKIQSDTLLNLLTISNQNFDKIRIKLEKIIFFDYIISSEVPAEYQEDRIELEEEYRNRFIISSGIISLAILDYLVNKWSRNDHNMNSLILLNKSVFPRILKVRERVIARNTNRDSEVYYEFYDSEERIENSEENQNRFNLLIIELSSEIKKFIEGNSDVKYIRSNFGCGLGQIFATDIIERNDEIAGLVKEQLKTVCSNLENYFFRQL
jgi:hypothetical protein